MKSGLFQLGRARLVAPIAVLTLACGGSEFTSESNQTGVGASSGEGGAPGGGGDSGGSDNGGSSMGGSSGGGATGGSSTGGVSTGGTATGGVSTGGAPVGCTQSSQCQQPSAACSVAVCKEGQCVIEPVSGCGTGGTSGGSCVEHSDCPAPPPVCNTCPDGSSICPVAKCENGLCQIDYGKCSTPGTCPNEVPTNGSACDASLITTGIADCSWGGDPRPECRTTGKCTGVWQVTTPTLAACEQPPLPAGCPSEPPADECAGTEPACYYPDGNSCFCSSCVGGSDVPTCELLDPPQWFCRTLPDGCPASVPNAGTPCDQEGLVCASDCDREVVCSEGRWLWRLGVCAICAAPDTPIDTPQGPRAISELAVGDLVYSVDHGAIVVVPIARVGSTRVHDHEVMRVAIEGGATLEISAGHPTADGRTFGDLSAGGPIDEQHAVASVNSVPYEHDRTYDILPASGTGTYFAAGVLIGSTLH